MVARLGAISAAALAVNLSQPALTQAVAKLERLLGRPLFDRRPGGMVPTEAGALLAGRVDRATDLLAEASRRARAAPLAHAARHLTMAQLRAALALERAGSYVLASRATAISEPSLHRAVGELEALLGVALLVRDGRAVRATPAAGKFVRPARLALAELRAMLDELAALDEAGGGRMRVGALPLARAGVLPRATAGFCAAHPSARVHIVEGPYDELLNDLLGGEIDLLVGALRDPCPSPELVQVALFEDSLFVVAAANHALAGTASIRPADTLDSRWVIGAPGVPLRARWEAWFAADGLPAPLPAVDCSSVIAIRGLLLEGGWLTLLSPDQFRIERAAGLLAPIGGALPGSLRAIGITTRLHWQPTRMQRAFLAALHAAGTSRLPQIE